MSDKKPDNEDPAREDPAREDPAHEDPDHDLTVEKQVAPEENLDWLPEPEPTEGGAPAP
ncbi:MAG TPA: hypothetical protein VGO99_02405 [Leifsonia sp.]|jgi:hypothetical protein|nr:hypothetical protein [Leifsonia sp.]